jgi:hypothetical protein
VNCDCVVEFFRYLISALIKYAFSVRFLNYHGFEPKAQKGNFRGYFYFIISLCVLEMHAVSEFYHTHTPVDKKIGTVCNQYPVTFSLVH